ncbi:MULTISPECIES: hypothetical protein [Ruminococcus]|uniref:Uncharacterized protein n=1 Tax=Ruminococcus albus (strain ATCC 27210 / DSM 20455 / JCM 14654 / NCDO 2250 / 7) TaxID=697329 RepID=E6UHE8_RUMA7|nr:MULTISPECIES: hypothetical protein [Ruminococcus]ADU21193.1 hypothetical protein Rumal_0645 [Ruminococcus albus 7 = DSM 20455]MCR5021358.1 hypothetical protein [Ruminococcus sp.]
MDCMIKNAEVKDAANTIKTTIKDEFATAGSALVTSFNAAIADMKGETKDALEEFFNTNIRDLVSSEESGIPAMVMGFGDLIESNRVQFASVDHTIAESIKGGAQ